MAVLLVFVPEPDSSDGTATVVPGCSAILMCINGTSSRAPVTHPRVYAGGTSGR